MLPPTRNRDRIRGCHRALSQTVDELAELAESVIRGRTALHTLVDRRIRELRELLARHHALESQALMPQLARGNGWGVILARHLAQVHRHQVGLVEHLAALGEDDPVDRAVQARFVAQALRDDLRQEERWLSLLPDLGDPGQRESHH